MVSVIISIVILINLSQGKVWHLRCVIENSEGIPIENVKIAVHTLNTRTHFKIPNRLRYSNFTLFTDRNGIFILNKKCYIVNLTIKKDGYETVEKTFSKNLQSDVDCKDCRIVISQKEETQ